MRTVKIVLFCAFVFLSVNTITAQYGNSNGYGGSNNGYGGGNGYGGRNQSQMSQMGQDSQMGTPKAIPTEVTVGKIMENLKKELNLDALQEVVVSNVLTKTIKKQEAIQKREMSDEDKLKEFTVLGEMTDLEIIEILNKEQKTKYLILSEERKSKTQSRKH